jgi:hypothetical protein
MKKKAMFRSGPTTAPVNLLLAPDDLRALSVDPAVFPACAAYARQHYPRMSMARLAS